MFFPSLGELHRLWRHPRRPSCCPSLLFAISPPPVTLHLLPPASCHSALKTHSQHLQDAIPAGAGQKASDGVPGCAEARGGPDRRQLLPGPRRENSPSLSAVGGWGHPSACQRAGPAGSRERQGRARRRASRPGWKPGFRVGGLRGMAGLCVQSCPTAAPPKPYPRFLRTPDPLTAQEKSLQMPRDPHGCHGHGFTGEG